MDPLQWLEKAKQIKAAYLRNPKADPSAMNTFRAQAGDYLGQQELEDTQYPGRAIGGSGATGLAKNDSFGYGRMLEGKQARVGLTSFLSSGNPTPDVRYGGDAPGTEALPSMQGLSRATGVNNAASFDHFGGSYLPASFGGAETSALQRQIAEAKKKAQGGR